MITDLQYKKEAHMKFTFKIQQYQTDAVNAIVDVFAGQGQEDAIYRRDLGTVSVPSQGSLLPDADPDDEIGHKNANLTLTTDSLLENIHTVQNSNDIKLSSTLYDAQNVLKFDVEMETGTGKTYVYIKTIFELHRKYGWSKFIIVVPSIAIREGVQKSFSMMQDHFMELYGIKARYFIYNSKRLEELDTFSKDNALNIMIINTQAFSASLKEGGRSSDSRIIYTERDDFNSRRPIDIIRANQPIMILDEPQKMGGTVTQKSILGFNPLFILNYSATHKVKNHTVYALDALEAYNQRLVKKIEVKGFTLKNLKGLDSHLYVAGFVLSPTAPPKVRLEFEMLTKGGIARKIRLCSVDDDLHILSGGMKQYEGFSIAEIAPQLGTVTFTNGKSIAKGDVINDKEHTEIRRIQIRETIESHFEKEEFLYNQGIKTLSLFFIDEVAQYRQYGENGEEVLGEYGKIFEKEYVDALNEKRSLIDSPYQQYLATVCNDVTSVHKGYFSIDKKGKAINSTGKDNISEDISAYELILKNKERLLSFEEPTRFIFSHSALREGWDNPNVFQICTLKHSQSEVGKRQEVGRGLRLCVNQNGGRMDSESCGASVHDINKLTVIASESYESFVKALQEETKEHLFERPSKVTMDFFENKTVVVHGTKVTISKQQGQAAYNYLIRNAYIDDDGNITQEYKDHSKEGTLAPMNEKLQPIENAVHMLMRKVFDPNAISAMVENGHETKRENKLNTNFYKKEFQALWEKIQHKYAYRVDFDSDELIKKAVLAINAHLTVARLRYEVTDGEQKDRVKQEDIQNKEAFTRKESKTKLFKDGLTTHLQYDLVGHIAKGTKLTRKTVVAILQHIEPAQFALFKANPEEFLAKTIRLILEQKASMTVEHIAYNRTEDVFDSTVFIAEKPNYSLASLMPATKHIKDYIALDSAGEKVFAQALDTANEVCVYAKLPRGFHIPTPVGNYSPDWAIAFKDNKDIKHVYFVAETKGSMNSMELRGIEEAKIACAKRHFAALSHDLMQSADHNVVYDVVDSYEALKDIIVGGASSHNAE